MTTESQEIQFLNAVRAGSDLLFSIDNVLSGQYGPKTREILLNSLIGQLERYGYTITKVENEIATHGDAGDPHTG